MRLGTLLRSTGSKTWVKRGLGLVLVGVGLLLLRTMVGIYLERAALVSNLEQEEACARRQEPSAALGEQLLQQLERGGYLSPKVHVFGVKAYDCGAQAFLFVSVSDCGSSQMWSFYRALNGWRWPQAGGTRWVHCHDRE